MDNGKVSKKRRRRAHILLLADESRPRFGLGDTEIAEVLGNGTATAERVRKQYAWRNFRRRWNASSRSTHEHLEDRRRQVRFRYGTE